MKFLVSLLLGAAIGAAGHAGHKRVSQHPKPTPAKESEAGSESGSGSGSGSIIYRSPSGARISNPCGGGPCDQQYKTLERKASGSQGWQAVDKEEGDAPKPGPGESEAAETQDEGTYMYVPDPKDEEKVDLFATRVRRYVEQNSRDGVFTLEDSTAGVSVPLVLDFVDRETVWWDNSRSFQGCVMFHAGKRIYDVDFELDPSLVDKAVKTIRIHKVNGRPRFHYNADSQEVVLPPTPNAEVAYNLDTLVRNYLRLRSPEGTWPLRDRGRVWNLRLDRVLPATIDTIGWEMFTARARLQEGANSVEVTFTIDFTNWEILDARIHSVNGQRRKSLRKK